jgi:hypothetical protein
MARKDSSSQSRDRWQNGRLNGGIRLGSLLFSLRLSPQPPLPHTHTALHPIPSPECTPRGLGTSIAAPQVPVKATPCCVQVSATASLHTLFRGPHPHLCPFPPSIVLLSSHTMYLAIVASLPSGRDFPLLTSMAPAPVVLGSQGELNK